MASVKRGKSEITEDSIDDVGFRDAKANKSNKIYYFEMFREACFCIIACHLKYVPCQSSLNHPRPTNGGIYLFLFMIALSSDKSD